MIYNTLRDEYEPPHKSEELELFSDTLEFLKKAQENDFLLFLISNQPDYAKGKCTLEDIYSVHNKLDEIFKKNNIDFTEYYYCYHHPDGIIKEYSFECECRKPKPFFIKKAIKEYDIDVENCWIIGDRDTDIYCGQASGIKTVLILSENSKSYQGKSKPNFVAKNLSETIKIIIK